MRRHACTIYTIFEGTSEIQRLVIARAISGLHIQ
jgi:acyl-CoA dehydrogenase